MDKNNVYKRRTFAIISHPDAGKTTLTEKLLLFGGAIAAAGMVKARGDARRTRSDWMKVEVERGISVASSVMTFNYKDKIFNLLDTPGHEDFSEDTYRVLTAVDSAVMIIDAAKGIEAQTLKLFEVCRLRNIPIITFINKMDRDGLEPIVMLDEIENKLQLEVSPISWPIGMGRDFYGCFDILKNQLIMFKRGENKEKIQNEGIKCQGLDDTTLASLLPDDALAKLKSDVEMVTGVYPKFNVDDYLQGNQTPVLFGSAINAFGVYELLDALSDFAPFPKPQPATTRLVDPFEDKVSAFIFKIQANMDPKHHDRIAFARIASGNFKKGDKLKLTRTDKFIKIAAPITFLGQDRGVLEEGFPGDIFGIPSHGGFRIGDSLSDGENLKFTGIPSFAPEFLKSVRPKDPLKAKHLTNALNQIAEEGMASVFKPIIGFSSIVGVVGNLQFEVIADRIRTEFNLEVIFEPSSLFTARWVKLENLQKLKEFESFYKDNLAYDHDGHLVFLARNAWHLNKAQEDFPELKLLKVKE